MNVTEDVTEPTDRISGECTAYGVVLVLENVASKSDIFFYLRTSNKLEISKFFWQ